MSETSSQDPVIEALEFVRQRILDEAESAGYYTVSGLEAAATILTDEIESTKEWNRINAMTKEELNAKLLSFGYTEERLNQFQENLKKILEKHSEGKNSSTP